MSYTVYFHPARVVPFLDELKSSLSRAARLELARGLLNLRDNVDVYRGDIHRRLSPGSSYFLHFIYLPDGENLRPIRLCVSDRWLASNVVVVDYIDEGPAIPVPD